jgi:hypothetical protein
MATITVPLAADRTIMVRYVRAVHTLTTRVVADGTEVSIPSGSTIDGQALAASMSLGEGTYTVTVPDRIVVGGVTYNYSSYTLT